MRRQRDVAGAECRKPDAQRADFVRRMGVFAVRMNQRRRLRRYEQREQRYDWKSLHAGEAHAPILAYSATSTPDPPASFGRSFCFGNLSGIRSTVSA